MRRYEDKAKEMKAILAGESLGVCTAVLLDVLTTIIESVPYKSKVVVITGVAKYLGDLAEHVKEK